MMNVTKALWKLIAGFWRFIFDTLDSGIGYLTIPFIIIFFPLGIAIFIVGTVLLVFIAIFEFIVLLANGAIVFKEGG